MAKSKKANKNNQAKPKENEGKQGKDKAKAQDSSANGKESSGNSNDNNNNNGSAFVYIAYAAVILAVMVLSVGGLHIYNPEITESVAETIGETYQDSYRYLVESYGPSVDVAMRYFTEEEDRVGYALKQEHNLKPKHPIVMVPGFVTSGLLIWGGKPCARKHFRKRIWTAAGSIQAFMQSPTCWLEHMALDFASGMDPDGIRLRAAEGMPGADYFFGPFWVFGKIIENLADIGYDTSNMSMEPYDWRLAYPNLEERDGYFTLLKHRVESFHERTGEKVVIASHSMGANVVHYFMAWVTHSKENGGGGGGEMWVDEHVHAYVNIAGPHLGVSKAASALLSGEMSDTALFMGRFADMLEKFLSRRVRMNLWGTWGSLWAMLPRGGNEVWSTGADICKELSSDDPFCSEAGNTPFIVMNDTQVHEEIKCKDVSADGQVESTACEDDDDSKPDLIKDLRARDSHSTDQLLEFLQNWGAGNGPDIANAKLHAVADREENPSSRSWHDATVMPLPNAPNLRIYCIYGHGIQTERSFYYRRGNMSGNNETESEPPIVMANHVNNEGQNVSLGVRYSDGDGSVPVLSLGYICADAWQRKDSGLNPHGVQVTTREYLHQPEFQVNDPMRSGPKGGEHCDILGNDGMLGDLIRVATDFDTASVNENRFNSDILEMIQRMDERGGGIRAQKADKTTEMLKRSLGHVL